MRSLIFVPLIFGACNSEGLSSGKGDLGPDLAQSGPVACSDAPTVYECARRGCTHVDCTGCSGPYYGGCFGAPGETPPDCPPLNCPFNNECRSDADCAPGTTCAQPGSGNDCALTGCPDGEACSSAGYCGPVYCGYSPGMPPWCPPNFGFCGEGICNRRSCKRDGDCPQAGSFCVDNYCYLELGHCE